MPRTTFDQLPDDARVWVFAADARLSPAAATRLMAEVDVFLDGWQAHGAPLLCAQDMRDARFLAIGVDQRSAGASGCSTDGLFRVLQRLGPELGASLLPSGRIYWRDTSGDVQSGERAVFAALAAAGEVTTATHVFDTTVLTAAGWRYRFEVEAEMSWHRVLMSPSAGTI